MSRLLITTVGTSLLTNRDDRPWAGWARGVPLPDAAAVDGWLGTADPARATAETNTLRALPMDENDRVLLIHSDTPEGEYCSARLAAWAAARSRAAEQVAVRALGYDAATSSQRGLRGFVEATLTAVERARRAGLEPVLCATGGFKAEIAFANLVGALLEVEVYYIHEQYREVVRLPRLPLTWDAAAVVRHRDFFEWIDAEPRPSLEAEGWLAGRPELRSLVEESADGCTYLNAAGELLYRAARDRLADGPRAVWPAPDPRPPREKNGLSGVEHHRPRGWERVVERLCVIDCVRRVVYDAAVSAGPAVRVLDGPAGVLAVRHGSAGSILPLRVETTATSAEQAELVAAYLRRVLR